MGIKDLMGSLTRDLFRWWHKQIPGANSWYASDGDLFLLDKNKIICLLDYKYEKDSITFCEKILYKNLGIPVYIIKDTVKVDNNTIRFNKKDLKNHLRDLGVKTDDIKTIMEMDIKNILKTDTINTMEKNLSVWDYIPDNSKQGYSSKLISNNYIGWEAELRERRKP